MSTARRRQVAVSARTHAEPAWIWIATLVGVVAGFAASVYLTVEHYTASTTLACPENSTINCLKVTTSPWSSFLGIPLPLLGLIFFAGIGVLAVPILWRHPSPLVRWSRLGLAGVGVASVVYLVYVELFKVNSICLWCTAVHVLTFGVFVLTAYREAFHPPSTPSPAFTSGRTPARRSNPAPSRD